VAERVWCSSCLEIGERDQAVTTRYGEPLCRVCADEVDYREAEEAKLREARRDT
jgi:hypothetical protein